MKLFLSLLFFIILGGCAAPRANYAPTSQAISEPPLNSINTIAIGDIMVRQGEFTEHEAIFVSQPISAGAYTIQPGNYLKTGQEVGVEFYYPGGSEPGRVDKSMFADNWSSVIIKNSGVLEICVLTVYGTSITTCNNGSNFQRRKVSSLQRDSFQQTLIYNGKIGNKVNIAYREFSNSLARPAFNNNVEYDLSESKIVSYKGAQFEIIEATNQHIKFRLIKNFNSATR